MLRRRRLRERWASPLLKDGWTLDERARELPLARSGREVVDHALWHVSCQVAEVLRIPIGLVSAGRGQLIP